ncbi:MAG: glycine cleavage system aminomethyltransferase GcvT, partial [Proteobacteria bacterium]|nr:glycine cleavage system aminomethyltransferase GcvT [Pseudomonadota bacterium]
LSEFSPDYTAAETGLDRFISFKKPVDFIGRAALEKQQAEGVDRKLVGLLLEGRGVLRAHQKVICAAGDGETTSGSFSPTLGRSIGMARVPAGCGGECEVEIRGRVLPAKAGKTAFVRNGKAVV